MGVWTVMGRPHGLPRSARLEIASRAIDGEPRRFVAAEFGISRDHVRYYIREFYPDYVFLKGRPRNDGERGNRQPMVPRSPRVALVAPGKVSAGDTYVMDGFQPVTVVGVSPHRVTYRRQNGTVDYVDRETFRDLYRRVM